MQSWWWFGCRGGFLFLLLQTETGWNRYQDKTYPKLFHLFFLQARCVKIEAWLKRQVQGLGGGQDYVDVMPRQTNKREMIERWDDTRHMTSPHINLKSAGCGLVHHTLIETSSEQTYSFRTRTKVFSGGVLILQFAGSVCRGQSYSAAVKLSSTNYTHCGWHQFCDTSSRCMSRVLMLLHSK